jgi:hypothetical protein
VQIWPIVKESLQGSALSALLLGIALGLFTNPTRSFDTFYEPLFRGLLSVLMLIMGIEAYARLNELRRVAHWFAVYAALMPIVHGLIAFGLGYIAHVLVGFSPGGVVLLAIIAGSSSDISGPPTLRAGIPTANPSSYIGASTSIGTPVAIAIGIPLYIGLAQVGSRSSPQTRTWHGTLPSRSRTSTSTTSRGLSTLERSRCCTHTASEGNTGSLAIPANNRTS